MTKMNCQCPEYRQLRWWERQQLERQGCCSREWERVRITDDTDLSLVRGVRFCGDVSIGALGSGENVADCGIENARICDCTLGDNVTIRNIGGALRGCRVGDRAVIENTARVEFEPSASCGLLTAVNVLDETGSRPVYIYPGLSAQVAWLSAHYPHWAEETLRPMLDERFDVCAVPPEIGADAVIRDCGPLVNVRVYDGVTIQGARSLKNGMVVNNAPRGRELAYVGSGVDAENFIVEDGVVDSGSLLRNCYVGQGVVVDKGFTAHDTLMFANTSLENGEACAVFAGPYTVSMHKSSLLIGCELSFMNAGSGTNQSNHMYKLGPVHWGIMQRGVKTSSSSYVMWGAKIGAFSMIMGTHKNHPDTSDFPFSYIFGDEKGATTVVPGMMLRSCGLARDEKKWPVRDRRLKRRIPMHDRINFPVLNPVTVSAMASAMELIDSLIAKGPDDDLFIRHKGMKFRASSLDRAKKYYTLAIAHYLQTIFGDEPFPEAAGVSGAVKWVDAGGQTVTAADVEAAMQSESLADIETVFTRAAEAFADREKAWIAATLRGYWACRRGLMKEYSEQYLQLTADDRASYRRSLDEETAMLLS